jgi:hypothetical protein
VLFAVVPSITVLRVVLGTASRGSLGGERVDEIGRPDDSVVDNRPIRNARCRRSALSVAAWSS